MQKYIFFLYLREKNEKMAIFFLQLKKKSYLCKVKSKARREGKTVRVSDNKRLACFLPTHQKIITSKRSITILTCIVNLN